ncbi:3-oxoacyl-[acyl-carrier-protein] synthase-3 [Anaerobranca californiensis DSM 14826]|jgi:3-oxoacyl-[acyl-carrier-protein] synthase-3|uniref:3-oxoacyl-[acyl-carrier-protein] synthase-3 n=1 Tax=Anaerobranca californiensis DSM 14826 TaxID=1120989 RepID=A0A1M6NTX6_9FIRM|nr:ketoacyl-ACP synthase III [Anaerobranca californiensis]SHJ99074.1 3-oxoacyl-[acyl-carrier-protein] synthase-3 [Anaerobranca californiensis DSM 14826]
MKRAVIIGTGLYVPKNLITNQEMEKMLGQPLKPSLEEKLGIKQRYITNEDESSADLATKAGEKALESSKLKAEDLDLIIVTTDTPEYISPATSSVVQGRLKAKNAGTFDLNASCAGFVTGLDVAARMIMTGGYNNILLIGVYNMTKYVDKTDVNVFPIFADGAGAVVLSATSEERGFVDSKLIADGTQYDFLGIYGGGTKHPITHESIEKKQHLLQFLKPLPPDRNIKLWPPMIRDLLEKNSLKVGDIDHIFFTQINKWVIEEVMSILELPMDKTTCIMDQYGYTGSACIPMALDIAIKKGKIKRGDNIIFISSGVGFAVAAALFKW